MKVNFYEEGDPIVLDYTLEIYVYAQIQNPSQSSPSTMLVFYDEMPMLMALNIEASGNKRETNPQIYMSVKDMSLNFNFKYNSIREPKF